MCDIHVADDEMKLSIFFLCHPVCLVSSSKN